LKNGEDFLKGRYSRGHTVRFDGGTVIPASASPQVVGKWAVEAAVDPEEMLVAALSNCHMLSFLHVARLAGLTVGAYSDHAEGVMEGDRARKAGRDKGYAPSANRVEGFGSREWEAGAVAS
jgi:organic hydroperoxide reductase OsmC/OhrA